MDQLISTQELSARLDDQALRIVDCRFDLADFGAGRADYLATHIPGAVFADLNTDLAAPPQQGTGRHPLPSVAKTSHVFGQLGIDPSIEVVVYDASNGSFAARTWWMLRWLGHMNVRLLDGGFSAWRNAGLLVAAGSSNVATRQFEARERPGAIISTAEILAAGQNISDLNLFDARDAARFSGQVEPIDPVAGHIPGAKNTPFMLSIGADGLWKERAERRKIWRSWLGPERNTSWVAMCGSGVTACHLAVSAVDSGFAEPRLYVGSWSEWIADPQRPISPGRG